MTEASEYYQLLSILFHVVGKNRTKNKGPWQICTYVHTQTWPEKALWAAIKAVPIIMIMNLASVRCLLSPGNEFVPKVAAVIAH